MRLRITEAGIELQEPGFAILDHQAGVEYSLVGVAFCRHPLDSREHDPVHDLFVDVVGDDRGGRVRPHAPGVGSLIVVVDRFVILRRGHWQDRLAIGKGEEGCLLTRETLFNDHP